MPPPEHRWQPGQSGNPKGRPKGLSITTLLHQLLDKLAPGTQLSIAEALTNVAVREAMKGDFRFFKEIWDRVDGPVAQKLEVEGTLREERILLLLTKAATAIDDEHQEALAEIRRLSEDDREHRRVRPAELPE